MSFAINQRYRPASVSIFCSGSSVVFSYSVVDVDSYTRIQRIVFASNNIEIPFSIFVHLVFRLAHGKAERVANYALSELRWLKDSLSFNQK